MGHLTYEQMLLLKVSAGTAVLAYTPFEYLKDKCVSLSPSIWPRGKGIWIGNAFMSDDARLRHSHIVGATGTGKTVLLESLIFKDIKRGGGVIIIDPKGERIFYDRIKAFCQSIGREKDLYFLSATFKDESAIWNPCRLGTASELQTKFFNSSVYSEPHYAKACEYGLLKAFNELRGKYGHKYPFSIRHLNQTLATIGQDDRNETLKGLFFDLNNLLHGEWSDILACDVKSDSKSPKKEISILDIVKNDKILFIDLPTEGKKVQSSRIGRLITQEIILLSGMRKRDPSLKSKRPFSVYIDEFDAFATESFSTFLNKGRSSEFMIHLAHQTLSDLNAISKEFAGQIMGNCNVRFIFRQDDPDDAERWSCFLGTETKTAQTFRTKDGSKTGEASNRVVQKFKVPPDEIKSLGIGSCIFSVKTEKILKRFKVPFKPLKLELKKPEKPADHAEPTSSGTSEPKKSVILVKRTEPFLLNVSTGTENGSEHTPETETKPKVTQDDEWSQFPVIETTGEIIK